MVVVVVVEADIPIAFATTVFLGLLGIGVNGSMFGKVAG